MKIIKSFQDKIRLSVQKIFKSEAVSFQVHLNAQYFKKDDTKTELFLYR